MRGIYKITNLITGDFYIGKAMCVERRWVSHFTPKARGHSQKFKEDISKYGKKNFKCELIEECSEEELLSKEAYYIKTLKPTYNTVVRGERKDEAFRKKVSEGTKRWWNALPEEAKQKVITDNLKGPAIGHKVSEHTRELLRQANLGKKRPHPVVIVETGQIFNSPTECANYLGVTSGAVCYNLRGKTELTKGYHIEYLSSVETMGDECNPVGQEMSCCSKCMATEK